MKGGRLLSLAVTAALLAAVSCGNGSARESSILEASSPEASSPETSAAVGSGQRDFYFDAGGVAEPTGEYQSKLWFNDGFWWGSLFDRESEEYRIHRYDEDSLTWKDTGTPIDERNISRADALWDGGSLYVVSAGSAGSGESGGAHVSRYSYDPAAQGYSRDSGFPVTISDDGAKVITIDRDSTGKIWVTYVQDGRVFIDHSLDDERSWAGPSELAVSGTDVTTDDISSVVSFGSKVGVMWSNQDENSMYFATHEDGAPANEWERETAISRPGIADDHISLRAESGRVIAAIKTSLSDPPHRDPNGPLTLVLEREPDGEWSEHTFGRVSENHTRVQAQIDRQNRELYVFATSGGAIYYKKTSLDDISFPEGKGTPIIDSDEDEIVNNATSTKQSLDGASDLLVLASDKRSGFYLHNTIDLDSDDASFGAGGQ